MRLALVALLLAGCWYPRDPRVWTAMPTPPDADRALAIVADVYGMPGLRTLKLQFFEPMCDMGDVGHTKGYLTQKSNCVQAAATPYSPGVNVCWYPSVRWSTSGFAEGVWEQYEVSLHGEPGVYKNTPLWLDGTAPRKIAEAEAALRAAGL